MIPDELDATGEHAAWDVAGGRIHVAYDHGNITVTGIHGATLTADAADGFADALQTACDYATGRATIATLTSAEPFTIDDPVADEHYVTAVRNQLARYLNIDRNLFVVTMSADDGMCWWIIPKITIARQGREIQQIMWTADEGWGVIFSDAPDWAAFANIHDPRPGIDLAAHWLQGECTGNDPWT